MDDASRLERTKYTGRETSTVILECDRVSMRKDTDGGVVVELFRYGSDGKALEGYQLHLCDEDRKRLEQQLHALRA